MPKTKEKLSNYERTKELTDRLENGMKDLFQSDKYKNFLKSMSVFHNYSRRNIMLINMQMPRATRIASYNLWKEKFNRQVKRGETGIQIFAPVVDKNPEKKLMEKLDPDTGAPLLDKDGKVIMEEMTALGSGVRFKLVSVFDISQTVGDPLPELVENLTGNVEHYSAFMDALEEVSPLPIKFEPLREGHDGYCLYGEKIGIREGMSEIQTVSAAVHEITHARVHDKDKTVENAPPKSKEIKEIEAESISYVVCQRYGIETSPNSFGYLAEWGSRDLSEFKASLDTIRKEANSLINAIDDRFGAICNERGIDLSQNQQEKPSSPLTPAGPEFSTVPRTETNSSIDSEVKDIEPQIPAQTDEAAKTLPELMSNDDNMPDPAIGIHEMNLYGYQYEGFLPLTQEKALELYDKDQPIYLLYPDNTEALAFDRSEIQAFGGLFGIDRGEWARMREYTVLSAQNSEAAKESGIINGNTDMFGIYQLKDIEGMRNHRYASLKELEAGHFAVDRSNYDLVYTAPLPAKETLDDLYRQFNADHPKDFTGRSMSVSDVVVIQRGGEVTSHYVDSFGFAELPAFLGNEREPGRAVAAANTEADNKGAPPLPAAVPAVKQEVDNPIFKNPANIKVYMPSPDHARENGELDKYRESLRINKECASAIDAAIKDCITIEGRGYRLTPESVNKVIDAYGEQRVNVVLANTVLLSEWDGRYSKDTKGWAKSLEMPQVRDKKAFFSAAHPAVVDGYIRLMRKEAGARDKKPSILDALKQGADRVKQDNPPQKETQQKITKQARCRIGQD